jgi:hypothetical protein
MGFRFHRSIKLLPGVRLNFGKRGISASIGVRGAHVTYGPSGTRTSIGLPGTGLSYTHLEKSHHGRSLPTAVTATTVPTGGTPPTDPTASPGSARRGLMWIVLLAVSLVVAIGRLTSPAPPRQLSAPQTVTQTATQAAARAAEQERTADVESAALGVVQMRHTLANSATLKLARVTALPNDTTCYQLHLQNSRGVDYGRTAVRQGAVLTASGSSGFAELWNRVCARRDGRDITSQVDNVESSPKRESSSSR